MTERCLPKASQSRRVFWGFRWGGFHDGPTHRSHPNLTVAHSEDMQWGPIGSKNCSAKMLNWTSSKRIDSELQPKQNENLNETEKLKSNRKCKGALNGQNRYGNAKWWRGELSRKGWNVKIDLIKWSNVQQDHSIQGSATQSTNCNCKWNSWKVNHWQEDSKITDQLIKRLT